jgi:hypothetical protein
MGDDVLHGLLPAASPGWATGLTDINDAVIPQQTGTAAVEQNEFHEVLLPSV